MTSDKARDHRRKKGTSTVDVSHEEHTSRRLSKKKTAVTSRLKDPKVRRSEQERKGIYLGEYRRAIVSKKQKFDAAKRSQQVKLREGEDDGAERKRMRELQEEVSQLRSNMDAELSNHPLFSIEMNEDLDADGQLQEFKKYKKEELEKDTGENKKTRDKRLKKSKKEITKERKESSKKLTTTLDKAIFKSSNHSVNNFERFQDLAEEQPTRAQKDLYTRYVVKENGDTEFTTLIGKRGSSQYLLQVVVADIDDEHLSMTFSGIETHPVSKTIKKGDEITVPRGDALGSSDASVHPYTPSRPEQDHIRNLIVKLVNQKFDLKPSWKEEDFMSKELREILLTVSNKPDGTHLLDFTISDDDLEVISPTQGSFEISEVVRS